RWQALSPPQYSPVAQLVLSTQPTQTSPVGLQKGVAVPQAGFLCVLLSFDEGAQAWNAPATQAGRALSVQALFSPPAFCPSRHTTQPWVLVSHTGVEPEQSLLPWQPEQVPAVQKGLFGSVQSEFPWHCPHQEPLLPAKQCWPVAQFASFEQPCRQ